MNNVITSEKEVVPLRGRCGQTWATGRFFKTAFYSSAFAASLCLGGLSKAALIEEWTGNHYTSGNWTDDVGNVVATASGTPLAVTNAFGTNTGVFVNGGYFTIPAGAGTSGLSNFTIVVVIKPTVSGPYTPNYYNGTPLAAFDIGGSGQLDVGLSWAGEFGQSVVDGVGTQNLTGGGNGDILETTPSLLLNTAHAIALQVNATALTITTYADGAPVATNTPVAIFPRSSTSIVYVGGGTFNTPTFAGQIAAIQFYNDATTNCSILTQNLLTNYATPLPITLPISTAAAVGQSAPVTLSVPASAVASGPLTVTLTSGTPGVVASTTVVFAKNQISVTTNLPVLALGASTVTASAAGTASSTTVIAGLDFSGLANDWLANTFVSNNASWTDSVGGVVAAGSGVEVAVPAAFGTTNQGVARNNTGSVTGTSGFIIPAGTAPAGLTNYTIVVVFKPAAAGPKNANYYGSDIMFGFDIGGSGQQDFGMSWGGNNGQGAGQEIVVGLGRSGGDTQIQSLPYPLGLNVTHAACLQVNGTAGTFTLYVDGVQCGQVTGLVMNQVNAQSIPMINQSDSNIGQAFAGYLAEVQVYTNDNINGAVVTSVLQSKYGSLDPLVLALVGNAYVDINSNVSLTVTAPATATANGSFTVTLTSGNPAVAGNSTATLAKGTTSTNISLQILGEGVSQVTASGSGVGSVAIQVGGLTPRSVVETFHASSLTNANQLPGITDGQTVSQWNGDILGTPAYQGANGPAYHTNATLAGTPAVVFTGTNQTTLDIPNISDPTVGLTNFSIVAVFQATAPGAGGVNDGQWWNDAGIADHELPGSTYDWGLELDSGGYFEWGTGQPDHEMWVSNYNVVNPLFHVIIGTYDTLNGISTATVDDQPSIINSNLFSQPRLADDIRIGFSHDNASAFLSGELVELDFYNGALNATERTNLAATLKSTYRLIWPDQSLISIAANPPDAEIGSTVQLTITIPAGANNSTAVPVTLTSGSPSVLTVGGGSSNTITFPAGAANVQTIAAQIVGAGTSVISVSASAAGLVSNTLSVIGLAVPSAIEQFHAYSLTNQIPGIANGQAVPQWLGAILSTPANANPNAPTFHANATKSGLPSVVLNATNATSLDIPSANDPTAGLAQFSVVAVFKDYNVATNDNDSFYTEAGIADHELPGATYDWGLEINGAGEFAWGTGAPDTTVPYPTIVVSDGLFHTVIGTYDTFLGISAIYLDDLAPVVTTGLKSGARLPDDIVIGSGHPGSYLSGELAELDFYNGALSANEAETVIANLDKMYGLTPPPVSYPIAITRSGTTVQISFPTVASIGGSQLQTTTNLLGTWTVSPLTFVTNGTQNVASDSLTNVSKFYRLYHP